MYFAHVGSHRGVLFSADVTKMFPYFTAKFSSSFPHIVHRAGAGDLVDDPLGSTVNKVFNSLTDIGDSTHKFSVLAHKTTEAASAAAKTALRTSVQLCTRFFWWCKTAVGQTVL